MMCSLHKLLHLVALRYFGGKETEFKEDEAIESDIVGFKLTVAPLMS